MRNLLLCLALLAPLQAAHAEPFAKVPSPPPGFDDPFVLAALKRAKDTMPDASTVAVPCYPGAVAIDVYFPTNDALPVISLLSDDPVETVMAWYRDKLADWRFSGEKALVPAFWKGPKDMKSHFAPTETQVVLGEAIPGSFQKKLTPKAKTRISVYFVPPGHKPADEPDSP